MIRRALLAGLIVAATWAAPAAADEMAATVPAVAPGVVEAPSSALVTTTVAVPPQFRQGQFMQDRQLQIAPGFAISVYGLVNGARAMTVAPWGEVLVVHPRSGSLFGLPDWDGDGAADEVRPLAQGLQCPYGMAFHNGYLYVAQSTKIERFSFTDPGAFGPAEPVAAGFPQSACAPHHFRPLTFDPSGSFFIAFGSSCNVCVEPDPRRGTVWQFSPDGSGGWVGREYARGLRNVVDLDVHPTTGQLWVATNERDALGDDVPTEPVGPITEGANYGWPYCYWNGSGWAVDSRVRPGNPGCSGLTPYNGVQAHSAPLGITHYVASQFPTEYGASAYVGLHGSWNHTSGVGYQVLRIPAPDGQPRPAEEFISGWMTGPQRAWGRPVDTVVGANGALYVSDDGAGAIYRVWWNG